MSYNQRFEDNFTEHDVINCLMQDGKRYKDGSRYILAQCPTHEDRNPSVQIFKDDWFVNCHAGCGRYHITKAYPQLKSNFRQQSEGPKKLFSRSVPGREKKVSYKSFDLMDTWKEMPLIPRDHEFKTIPLEVLDSLGWRWDAPKESYFIPYFSRSKDSIPFAQWRHLHGERRFTFLKDAKPTCYGTWNLHPGDPIFIVEGCSDSAVLEHCAVPWLGLPSAASGELLKAMATWASQNDIKLVYAGDRDSAGDKLRESLDEIGVHYRIKQPRSPYKDWGDMLEAEGQESIIDYCYEELFGPKLEELDPVESVLEAFPGAEIVEGDAGEVVEQQKPVSPLPLF